MSGRILVACAGFLLAVLWMDLIFDSQIGRRSREPDEAVLASISAYYRRATTTSRPMSALIALVMVTLLVTLAYTALEGSTSGWVTALSALLAGGPILLAWARTVPAAVRLGGRADPPDVQARLARAIRRDHLICSAGIFAFLVLRLVAG